MADLKSSQELTIPLSLQQLAQLEEKLKELKEENQKLKDENQELKEENQRLWFYKAEYESQNKLREKNDELGDENDKLIRENKELREKNKRLSPPEVEIIGDWEYHRPEGFHPYRINLKTGYIDK